MVDSINRPMMIYCDSKGVVFFSGNNKSSGAAKHIDIKYLVVRQRIQDQTIKISRILLPKAYHQVCLKSMQMVWVWWIAFDPESGKAD